jgi:ribosomal protein S18 acetylase RimI-like enzyme
MIVMDNNSARDIVEAGLKVSIYEPFIGFLIVRGKEVAGACIFNCYEGRDIHFTCVLDGPVGMGDARRISRYVFEQLRCERVTAVTRPSNTKAGRALQRLGFKPEGLLRNHYDNEDAIVYGLLKEEQKVLKNGFVA